MHRKVRISRYLYSFYASGPTGEQWANLFIPDWALRPRDPSLIVWGNWVGYPASAARHRTYIGHIRATERLVAQPTKTNAPQKKKKNGPWSTVRPTHAWRHRYFVGHVKGRNAEAWLSTASPAIFSCLPYSRLSYQADPERQHNHS